MSYEEATLADSVKALALRAGIYREREQPTEPETPPETSDGILDDAHDWLTRFVRFTSPHHGHVVTLWVAHTHLLTRSTALAVSPRLGFLSGIPGTGKTTVQELISKLSANGYPPGGLTAAAILRVIMSAGKAGGRNYPVTIALDELDNAYKSAGDSSDLTEILNHGYVRGRPMLKADKEDQTALYEYDTFANVVFGGLAIAKLPPALLTRSIMIHMQRALPEERPEPYFNAVHDAEGAELRNALDEWADRVMDGVTSEQVRDILMDPRIRDEVQNRDHQLWSALWFTAVRAGGHWPERLIAACKVMLHEQRDREMSAGQRALIALREHYKALTETGRRVPVGIPWKDAANAVVDADERFGHYFGRDHAITGDGLRDLLRADFRIASVDVRVNGQKHKGARWSDLAEAWTRNLPDESRPDADGPDPDPAEMV